MYLKIHEYENSKVIAICDEDLIGKKLENKKSTIEITEIFYKGKSADKKEVKMIIENENNLNLIGKESVGCAIEEDIVKDIIWFGDIPHRIITSIKNDE